MLLDTLNPLRGDFKPNFGLTTFVVEGEGGGGDGSNQPPASGEPNAWFEGLADPLKTDPNITKYKSLDEFANGHLNAVKLIGQKGVIVPKPDAPQEEIDKFYNTLGRPEKAEGYKLSNVENLHKSIQVTPEASKAFMEQAHKLGLTNAQADNLNKWYMSVVSQALTNQDKFSEEKLKEVGTKLQQEWGKDYQQNLTLANRFLEKFGSKDIATKYLGEGADAELIKVVANAAKAFSEDSVQSVGFSTLAASKGEAQRRINEIMNNQAHPYWDGNHPEHGEWIGENGKMRELYKIAEGWE